MGSLLKLEGRLLVAIQNNDVDAAELLLQTGMDADMRFRVGAQERPAICLSVERGHIEMTQLLLRWGCSINQYDACGQTPLHIAAAYNLPHMVNLLLQNKANNRTVNNYGQTPLHLASLHNSLEIVQLLVDSSSCLDRRDHDGRTALAIACYRGNFKVSQFLTSRGADVNVVDNMGNTPLLLAVSASSLDPDLVRLLISSNAKVNVSNRHGETPLLSVISHGPRDGTSNGRGPEVVQALLDGNSDLLTRTPRGQSPLHLAVVHHQDTMVKQLVRCGASANSQDMLGLTPLFHLARDNKVGLVKLLIDSGVDFNRERWLSDNSLRSEILNRELVDWISSRSREVRSLKNLSRMCVRRCMCSHVSDKIFKLPLPLCIKEYLNLQRLC